MPHHDPARPAWRTSSYSGESDQCVEVANFGDDTAGIRDSKNLNGPKLTFSRREAGDLIRRVKAGDFDL